jgi:hypothetical protein
MTLKIHSGGCHCGAVRFDAEIDIAQGTIRCNCSSCAKARSWFALAMWMASTIASIVLPPIHVSSDQSLRAVNRPLVDVPS